MNNLVRQIRLMPDYRCWPLWWYGSEDVGNLDPAELGLSLALQAELQAWADVYDSWLNFDDPANSPSPSDAELEIFERTGIQLWRHLLQELGTEYKVVYFSQLQQRVLEDWHN